MANEEYSLAHTINSVKIKIKRDLIKLQNEGDIDDWQPDNFKLYNISGLRKSERIAIINKKN